MTTDIITAGELRDMGADIDTSIPDCAWVPRTAVTVSIDEHCAAVSERLLKFTIEVAIDAPWQWTEVTFTADVGETNR